MVLKFLVINAIKHALPAKEDQTLTVLVVKTLLILNKLLINALNA